MSTPERRTTRADAWQKVSDGLQINRYFIHIEPQMRERRRRLLELTGVSDVQTPTGLLECMWALRDERCVAQRNPWSNSSFAPLHSGSVPLAIDVSEGRLSPALSQTIPPRLAAAQRLLERVGLGFLPQLMIDCVLVGAPAEALSWADRAFGVAVLGPHDDTSINVAERLLRSAAARLLWCSYVWAKLPSARDPSTEPVWDGLMPRDSYAHLEQLYVLCMVLRFKSARREYAESAVDNDDQEVATLEARLQREGAVMLALLDETRSPRVRDLIVTSYPCEARFQQFFTGLGPGQSA